MVHKGFARNITGDHGFRRYTLHNDHKNQRSLGQKNVGGVTHQGQAPKQLGAIFFMLTLMTTVFILFQVLGQDVCSRARSDTMELIK